LPEFESMPLTRQGWHLHYEHWSPENLDRLRQAGARYFVSRYAYGLRTHAAARNYLDRHGRALQHTGDWVIYALNPPDAGADAAR
jgi:hypothetical protein